MLHLGCCPCSKENSLRPALGLDPRGDRVPVSFPWSRSTRWVPRAGALPLCPFPRLGSLLPWSRKVKLFYASALPQPLIGPPSLSLSLSLSLFLSFSRARDAKCGKIQCQSSEARPLESNAVSIDTTIVMNGRQIRCRGTHVYRSPQEEGDILDPGLVMAGTKCGHNHVSPFLQLPSGAGLQPRRP